MIALYSLTDHSNPRPINKIEDFAKNFTNTKPHPSLVLNTLSKVAPHYVLITTAKTLWEKISSYQGHQWLKHGIF